jgi:hypothetical protein
VTTSTRTNGSGIYDAPSVPTGEYTITFSKAGFRDFVRKGLVVEVGTITIDATLQLGAATEKIEVIAEAPLLQTDTSDQQVNFDNKAVLDAPIVGGVWFDELTKVLPGVGGGSASGGQSVAVNGTQSYSANFQIEGSAATDPRDVNASDNYPPIDAIGEVSVNTANAGAQNGNSLLSLNVNLKSGTNRWHGSAFEFVQNDVFESRNFFNSGKKSPVRWNEFGGSVGGPILKNKLFFYFTYQRNPVKAGNFYQTTVPTDAMRNGDFSSPLFKATIYDKSSCTPVPPPPPVPGRRSTADRTFFFRPRSIRLPLPSLSTFLSPRTRPRPLTISAPTLPRRACRSGTSERLTTRFPKTTGSLGRSSNTPLLLLLTRMLCAIWVSIAPRRSPTTATNQAGSQTPGPSARRWSTNFA